MEISSEELTRIDTARTGLRAALARERAATAGAAAQVQADWIQKLRGYKRTELLAEAVGLGASHRERCLARAAALRSAAASLVRLQAEGDAAVARHAAAMTALVDNTIATLQGVASRHAATLKSLENQVAAEDAAAAAAHASLVASLADAAAQIDANHLNLYKFTESTYGALHRGAREAWDERSGVARLLGEERAGELAATAAEVRSTTATATATDRKRHAALAAEDAVGAAAVEAAQRRVATATTGIAVAQARLKEGEAEWQLDVEEARAAKGVALERYTTAQREAAGARRRQERRLAAAAGAAGAAEGELTAAVAAAERVARGLMLCVLRNRR